MPRLRKPRMWVKIDCEGILRGSINYLLSLEGQAVWVKMIALSELCGGRSGFIEDNNQKGLPHDFISQELHCTLEQFETVLERMKEDKAIEVNGTGSIHLVNFHHYQFSEYDRQRQYRQNKKADNQDDRDKKTYGEFENVMLKDIEYKKLVDKFGEAGTKERIENLSSGIESKGYRYNSHYATILTWDRKDNNGNPKQKQQPVKHQSDIKIL